MTRETHINPQARRSKITIDIPSLFEEMHSGNVAALGRGITLIESTNPRDAILAQELITKALPYSGKAFRLGITGVPGVG
ncbi:MAG: methylmalonyl Co-A mutase-associated GTPase MeaB, partial [Nonlabens sp.]|nr:methylmalonyl Co-A mutase-associated GTPase MeaB [Nonlabens sp.]